MKHHIYDFESAALCVAVLSLVACVTLALFMVAGI